jgi:hypothetical protein
MNKGLLLPLIVAALTLEVGAHVKPGDAFIRQNSTGQVVIGEEPELSQPEVRMAREAKSARYNGGGCDITIPGRDCFFEQFAPGAVPRIPLGESDFALVGSVVKMQPYLSADRTHIYMETTIQVQELFKNPEGFRPSSPQSLIVDQIGGAMRTYSGRVILDESKIDFSGQTYVGGRYVFFLRQVHEGKDLAIVGAYELREGKVFDISKDGSPSNVLAKIPNKLNTPSDELDLLQTLRR